MKAKRIILFLLCLALFLSATVLPTALAAEQGSGTSDYDYSREGSYFNTTASSKDVLSELGFDISDAEAAYLDTYGNLSVRYERVTNQQIKVEMVNNETIITANPYTYVADNGVTVVWVPVRARLSTEVRDFDGGYQVNFGVLALDDDSSVSVDYELAGGIEISADDINAILNLAYSDAVSLKQEVSMYNDNADGIEDYLYAIVEYEQYLSDKLVYDQKKQEYDEYEQAKKLYQDQLPLYNDYLDKLEEYNNIKAINDERRAQYEKELERYNSYQSDLKLVEEQLKMLNDGLMNSATYLNRQLYGCLFANLVDEVVSNKDKLTKIGATKEDIDACAVASNNIRAILKPAEGTAYVNLKTTAERYAFYINNYEELRDNIITLTCTLYSIYTTPGIKATMHLASEMLGREDYTEKLAIFIAQLIYFSNALSDEPVTCNGEVLDGNVTLNYRRLSDGQDFENVKIYNLVKDSNDEVFVTDIDYVIPLHLDKVDPPTAPTLEEIPQEPDIVAQPIAPNFIEIPSNPPQVVVKPVAPV